MPTFTRIVAFLPAVAIAAACHSAPPPAPPPPVTLSDSAASAVRWVDAHAARVAPGDSVASAGEQHTLIALARDARVIGFSELTEGTHEFPYIVRRSLFALADSANVRGLAIQAPMAETMELDRFVRTGVGDPRRLMRTLGSWRWETVEMLALVNAIRERNRTAAPDKQIGFYGFELPTAAHAVQVVTALPDSITGPALGAWLRREYGCVAANEGAHWGLEGRLADSTFWQRCGPVTAAGVDSLVALRRRVTGAAHAAELAYAEQMARLIQHHVAIGLRRLPRQDAVAEHVLYLANSLGPDAKLVTWGGDVEAGRLTLGGTTVQSGASLGTKLGARYLPIAFVFADGSVRAQRPSSGRSAGGSSGLSGLRDVPIAPSASDEYEDVFRRASGDAYWLDVRPLVGDGGNTWLRGPHQARLITEVYAPQAPELFLTPLELPKFFDAVLFVRHVTAAHQ